MGLKRGAIQDPVISLLHRNGKGKVGRRERRKIASKFGRNGNTGKGREIYLGNRCITLFNRKIGFLDIF